MNSTGPTTANPLTWEQPSNEIWSWVVIVAAITSILTNSADQKSRFIVV